MSESVEFALSDEKEQVLLWRAEVLERAGYESGLASVLSAVPDVDIHLATDLLRRGCPPRVAVRILL
jgi:hypothetical protein